jgi:conjugal transfer pilus assembly protein TraW
MIKIRTLIGIIVISLNYICYAEDLGVVGKTYPILEPDMIEWIKAKADIMIKNGQWQQIQNQAIVKVKNQINNPAPVTDITDSTDDKTWYYKPMIQLKANLTDTRGHVIAKAGLYNALRYKPFDTQLLFINGNNKKQINWAVDHARNDGIKTKIVLTQGSFINLDKQYKIWFFYDQSGKYTKKLNIHHVPAIVTQDGEQLKIAEIDNAKL